MKLGRTTSTLASMASLALGAALVSGAPAAAAKQAPKPVRVTTWAPAATADITPGVQMYTDGAQCTGNFVFSDAAGGVYVGYAAHCAGTGAATDTDGCLADSLPLGTPVDFRRGGSLVSRGTQVGSGTLVYSAWDTMDKIGTPNGSNTCAYNDFALVKLAAGDVAKVNPSVPFWGGPEGIDVDGTQPGDQVYSYGNSSLRGGVEALSPKTGSSLGSTGGGWSHLLYTVTPGVPGDSGSGFLSENGKAIGTLSTLGLAPYPASNNIGDLAKELAFAQAHSGIAGLKLVQGTEPFSPVL